MRADTDRAKMLVKAFPRRVSRFWLNMRMKMRTAPFMLRAEQTLVKELSIVFVVYSFFAFTHSRYGDTAHQKITGVGLETPTFA